MYSIFIPVYAFLFLPIVAVLRGDTQAFTERVAELQWGLMTCVFCVSHLPALLTLDIPGFTGRNASLVAFLIIVVQGSDVLQYVWGKLFGKTKIAPTLSPSKDGRRLRRRRRLVDAARPRPPSGASRLFTPFQAGGMALAAALMGFFGGLVDVGYQARPRRQGLGRGHSRPWRHARLARTRSYSARRFSSIRRAIGSPSDATPSASAQHRAAAARRQPASTSGLGHSALKTARNPRRRPRSRYIIEWTWRVISIMLAVLLFEQLLFRKPLLFRVRGFRGLAIGPQLLAVGRGALLRFSLGALRDNSDRRGVPSRPGLLRALRVALGAGGNHDLLETPSRSAISRCSAKSLV